MGNMRKMIIMLLVAVLIMGTSVTASAASYEVPEYLRIGIKTLTDQGDMGTVTSDDDLGIYEYSQYEMKRIKQFDGVNKVNISLEENTISVTSSKDKSSENETELFSYDAAKEYVIMSTGNEDQVVTYNNTKYRGGMMIKNLGGSKTSVINVLGIEEYVCGVLPKEMPSSWHKEALKAQAVAARNFAALGVDLHKSDGYDLCTLTHCQVYGGISGEASSSNEAVSATEGVLIYYDGEPIAANYHKNSGGWVENAEDIWSSPIDFLKAKKDPYSPDYPWTYEISKEKLASSLTNSGYKVGDIKEVKVAETTKSGSVLTLEVVGSSGTSKIKKEAIRGALGYTNIKSLKFTVDGKSTSSGSNNDEEDEDNSGGTATSGESAYVKNGNGTSKVLLKDSYAIGMGGTKRKLSSQNPVYVLGSTGIGKVESEKSNQEKAKSSEAQSSSKSGVITFAGKGYGHCIGLAQDGAKVMAEQGFSYIEILKQYYTDIEVK